MKCEECHTNLDEQPGYITGKMQDSGKLVNLCFRCFYTKFELVKNKKTNVFKRRT